MAESARTAVRRELEGTRDALASLLYVFCGDQLLVTYLRPSNIDASKHSRAILKLGHRAIPHDRQLVKYTG